MGRVVLVGALLLTVAASPSAAQKYDPPAANKLSDDMRVKITAKTEELGKAIDELRKDKKHAELLPDVEIFHRAAEMIVQLGEFYQKDSPAWTLKVLDQGLERARQLARGESPWTKASGQTVVRGYRSEIDGTAQPTAVTYPLDYGKDPNKRWRVDMVLHGRNATLTEVSFLHSNATKKAPPADQDWVQIDVFGRGNNAYRWAGETDVFEALEAVRNQEHSAGRQLLSADPRGVLDRVVLRGFSMGGAGTWHIGLHHPARWRALGPGAGFTTTHGYTKLPLLPSHQEACLHIYDAVDYAENAFNVPIVAYSGSKDPQKAAADNIEKRLKELGLEDRMTHLIAPGLEHKFPPEWFQKANALYARHAAADPPARRDHVRFVTHTLKYPACDWVAIAALDRHYDRAAVDAKYTSEQGYTIKTKNVRTLQLDANGRDKYDIVIDGQKVQGRAFNEANHIALDRGSDGWRVLNLFELLKALRPSRKKPGLTGPIDDAFTHAFLCIRGTGRPWHAEPQKTADARLDRFKHEWAKYWRGTLPMKRDVDVTEKDIEDKNLILFGDPSSNPLIAKVVKQLPLQWSEKEIVFGGKSYPAAGHVPVMIYPNPLNPTKYVVLNSGHTIPTADYTKTNALLFPRLGDYALLTTREEVVTAGLFDESWQVEKK